VLLDALEGQIDSFDFFFCFLPFLGIVGKAIRVPPFHQVAISLLHRLGGYSRLNTDDLVTRQNVHHNCPPSAQHDPSNPSKSIRVIV